MEPKLTLSGVCLTRLEAWLQAHVRSALKDQEFMEGLLFIVQDEVNAVAHRERERTRDELLKPSVQ